MEKLQQLKISKEFICPNCGHRHSIDDAHVRHVLVKSSSDTNFVGNRYVTHIASSYANVRFCSKCKWVRTRNKILRHISYLLIGPLILMCIHSLLFGSSPFTCGGYFLTMAILIIIYRLPVMFFREVLSPALNKPLLQRAKDGNAIV